MLTITVPGKELFDERTGEFITSPETTLTMEHSLLSISKWESIHKKPFLSREEHTQEEIFDYFKCMTINKNVDENVYSFLGPKEIQKILDYMNDSQTATTIKQRNSKMSHEIITAEIVYYWMIMYGIPFSCEKWNFNRLMMLITVCGIKQSPEKKMSRHDALAQQNQLNDLRRARLGSMG